MKTKLPIAGVYILVTLIILVVMNNNVDTAFATEVALRYYNDDMQIDVAITDEKNLKVL